ncbi:unnamed protein product [Prorocentrum cordatum]|nr:unnamed protein product [Polarella glacialis]
MFCTSSREKGTLPPTACPRELRCTARGVDWLTLEFELVLPDDPGFNRECVECHVERLDSGLFERWAAVRDAVFEERVSRAAQSADGSQGSPPAGPVNCAFVLPNLAHESGFTFRILARGGPSQELALSNSVACRTADRPEVGCDSMLRQVARRAHAVSLEWVLLDPEGAPVEECELQYRCDGFVSGWRSACGRLSPAADTGRPYGLAEGARRWQGTIGGLEGASVYIVRARARNAVGWSSGFSSELPCRTADLPPAPRELRCVSRSPHSLVVCFALEDPEGAPVVECSADVYGTLGFHSFTFCRFEGVGLGEAGERSQETGRPRMASCTLEGLQPETLYSFRIWARNDSGLSRQPSSSLECRTSDRPAAPCKLYVKATGPTAFFLEFDVHDPEGAPVDCCAVEYSQDSLLSSWTSVEAVCDLSVAPEAPCSAPASGSTLAGPCDPVSAVSVRRYRVALEKLERETPYVFRARAHSCIGWSHGYSPTSFARTTDLPPTPQGVRCVARLPGGMRLEFTTAEIPDTAPISTVHIEDGTLSWQEVPILALQKSLATSAEPGVTVWSVEVRLGIGPAVRHTLRVWTQSSGGRCREPSATCICHTSDEPSAPTQVTAATRSAHSLELEWFLPDPEGAPVWQCEVQYSEDSALASWETAACADTQRSDGKENYWRCTVDKLKPCTPYLLRVRARNEVGWSSWDVGARAPIPTSGPPKAPSALAAWAAPMKQRLGAPAAAGNCLAVTIALEEPDDAPPVACVATWRRWDRRVSCQRVAPGQWLATFPQHAEGQSAEQGTAAPLTFGIAAANAVGWGELAELWAVEAEPPAELAAGPGCYAHCYRAGPLRTELHRALRERKAACGRVAASLQEAQARGDGEYASWLSAQTDELQRRVAALEEVARQVAEAEAQPPSSGGEGGVGAHLVARFQAAVRQRKLVPDTSAAAEVLYLLLRGCMWLEASWQAELGPFSDGVAELMSSVPDSGGRMLQHWIRQHHVWSEGFDRKVSMVLPDSLASCARILAALSGGGNLQPLESVRGVMEAHLELMSAAERQLRRLRQTRRVLQLAQGANSHNFEPPTIGEKIETTALSLLTTTVLAVAVPGATECGVARIGMLWLEGKGAGDHVALEHPVGAPIQPLLERLGWTLPSTAGVILTGWAGGGHAGVVLVHNLAARRITVVVRPDVDTLASRIGKKLSNAHPMVSAISQSLSDPDADAPGVTILPTDVALIQVPVAAGAAAGGATCGREAVRLVFCYGAAGSPDREMGWARVRPGSALSFVSLDGGLHVCNREAGEGEAPGLIEVANNDLAAVSVGILRAAESRKMFEKALATASLQPGERTELRPPQVG